VSTGITIQAARSRESGNLVARNIRSIVHAPCVIEHAVHQGDGYIVRFWNSTLMGMAIVRIWALREIWRMCLEV
jgi:predicted metallopeptidase